MNLLSGDRRVVEEVDNILISMQTRSSLSLIIIDVKFHLSHWLVEGQNCENQR